jgi:cell wall assembly regulator SMI1
MSGVAQAWARLLTELAERAPATRAALRGAADHDPEVADSLGIELPAEIREWFTLHGGAQPFGHGQVLPFNTVLSLPAAVDSVLRTRRIWWSAELVDHVACDRQPAGTVAGTWLASYLYIGQDGMGGGLFVDLRGGPLHGCVRFWDKTDADHRQIAAASITDLLDAVHGAITSGGGNVAGWTPVVDDGHLDWDDFDI